MSLEQGEEVGGKECRAIHAHDVYGRIVDLQVGCLRIGDCCRVCVSGARNLLLGDGDGAGITATGVPAVRGIAAVDPDVIPLGTRLFIPGYGEAIAADTGGAIVGNKIDLVMDSYGEAMDFGRQDVTVYVLD